MYTVFDCETTGLPKNWKAPMSDLDNWPRVIQLAWAHYGPDRKLIEKRCDLVKPDGWVMPTEQFWVENGFSQEESLAKGIPILDSLEPFRKVLAKTEYLIAHNISCHLPTTKVAGLQCLRPKPRA